MRSKTICLAPAINADSNGNYTGITETITGDNWFITSLIVNNQDETETPVTLTFNKSDGSSFSIPFKLTAKNTSTSSMALDLRIAMPDGATITITSSSSMVDAMISMVTPN